MPMMKRLLFASAFALSMALSVLSAQGPLTPWANLRGRTDSNGYLLATGNAYLAPDGPLTPMANLRVRTDANGYLMTALSAITGLDLGTTSTDGLSVVNTTPATAGVPVQISPRLKWCGTAWNSTGSVSETNCFFAETLPATVAGTTTATWKIGYINPAGTVTYPLTLTSAGVLSALDDINSSGNFILRDAGDYRWLTRSRLFSPADGQFTLTESSVASGVGLNVNTDAVLVIRTRAETADAAVRASLYNSSIVSALTVTANAIVPTSTLHQVGVGLIKNITVPATCTPTCVIFIEPTAAYTYDATGNILVPVGGGLALISKLMPFAWNGTKWVPGY